MAVAVGDIIRVAANFQWAAQDIFSNIFHIQVTVNTSVSDSDFMDKIANHFDTVYLLVQPDISGIVNFLNIEAINVTQDVLLPPKLWPTLTVGGNSGDPLPTQCAAECYWRTLRPRTRASKFLPPYGETTSGSGGVLDASAVSRLQDFADAWVDGVLELVVEANFGAYNKLLDRFTQAQLGIVAARFRTQRRRRIGVGS